MFMRVALGIHGDDMKSRLGDLLDDVPSPDVCTRCPPCSTPAPQMSSCTTCGHVRGLHRQNDTLKECEHLEVRGIDGKRAGEWRHIKGTNGSSDGIVPMAQVFNYTARYVNQGQA
jgi:hypothetical protein